MQIMLHYGLLSISSFLHSYNHTLSRGLTESTLDEHYLFTLSCHSMVDVSCSEQTLGSSIHNLTKLVRWISWMKWKWFYWKTFLLCDDEYHLSSFYSNSENIKNIHEDLLHHIHREIPIAKTSAVKDILKAGNKYIWFSISFQIYWRQIFVS